MSYRLAGLTLVVGLLTALACAQAPAEKAATKPVYQCHGNEPFWSLQITGSEVKRQMPGDEAVEETYAHGVFKQGEGWALWRGIFPDWDDTVAFVSEAGCEDGMAESVYPYEVILSLPSGEVYQGCCNLE